MWVRTVAQHMAMQYPAIFRANYGREEAGKRILIDYAQNSVGKNTAAPYTLRAHPEAPVSTPLVWEELTEPGLTPDRWNIRTVPDRIQMRGDVWKTFFEHEQVLPSLSEMAEQLGIQK